MMLSCKFFRPTRDIRFRGMMSQQAYLLPSRLNLSAVHTDRGRWSHPSRRGLPLDGWDALAELGSSGAGEL